MAGSAGSLVHFLGRLLLAALVSTAAAYAVHLLLGALGPDPHLVVALLRALAVTAVDVVVFVLLARVLRLEEVTGVLDTVLRRLPSRRQA